MSSPSEGQPFSRVPSGVDAPPAYILDLTVRNVRCFGPEEQTLRLTDAAGRPAPWTVILGDNGAGKTTLLQCLVALESRRHFFKPWEHGERPLVELPTYRGEGWRIYRDPSRPRETSIRGRVGVGSGRGLASKGFKTLEVTVPTSSETNPSVVFAAVADEALQNLRCCSYGATRRMGSVALNRGPEDPAASLFLDFVALVDAEEWLLVEDYARTRDLNRSESRLRFERVKRVLVDLLPDVEDLRIRESDSRSPKPAIEVKVPYGWVALADLSHGYRTMIAWTVDLASRLFMLYPDSRNPLAEPAVVLVDEVDLHLHPKWQREVREHLTERFPNAQFVVTAHSPLVVQASENENIVVLRRQGDHVVIDNNVETVRGWRVDQVLTSDLFGLKTARPPEYDDLIARRNALLAKPRLDEIDRARLEQLEGRIAALPGGDSLEDFKAMEIIRQAAAELKRR
ncbi:MAG TPA: AAA family ATPase [Thermoanaerobaculia bacterium]|nr:AAA family ATPase [Thermoanaerobaculia bacterium]